MKKTFLKPFVFICLSLVIATIAVASVVLDPPSPPRMVQVSDKTPNSCIVTYQKPGNDGGTPIISYDIECMCLDGGSGKWESKGVSTTLEHEINGLQPGSTILVRVSASNKVGKSEPTMLEKPVAIPLK